MIGGDVLAFLKARFPYWDPFHVNPFRFLEGMTRDRMTEFPTVDDDSLGMSESSTALLVSWDDSGPEPAGPFLMLLGLAGLLIACAFYPIVAAWVLFGILGGGKAPGLWAPTVGVAAGISLLLALLANRVIPGRVAVILIVVMPLLVKLVIAQIVGISGVS